MEVLLIRHGQTGGNVAQRHQAEHTPLNELGREQARAVAEKVIEFDPTHLIVSPLVRTIETARIINETKDLNVELDHNFVELKRPKYLHGLLHYSLPSIFYYILWFLGLENTKLAGESYAAVRGRIEAAKLRLENLPEDSRVVVVTHSVFMSLLVAHLCRTKALPLHRSLCLFLKITKMPNTHIIKLTHEHKGEGLCSWRAEET